MASRRVRASALMVAALVAAPVLPALTTGAAHANDSPRVVDVVAKRFEFAPNEITLRQGEEVTLRLTTQDVTHGFFMRALGIDTLIEPGHPTEISVTPKEKGTFITICDHFCGPGHSRMHMKIVVE